MAESQKAIVKVETHSPTESFTENEMLEYWFKYAQRLGDKGHKIMESLLTNNVPVLNGTIITVEVSNKGSKIDFIQAIEFVLRRKCFFARHTFVDIHLNSNIVIM